MITKKRLTEYVIHKINNRKPNRTLCGHSVKLSAYPNLTDKLEDTTCRGCINSQEKLDKTLRKNYDNNNSR
jgi:hypothetical protein